MMSPDPPALTESMESLPLSSSSSPQSARTLRPIFDITVSDPQKELGSFITYLITSRTTSGFPGFNIRRRFRDFLALADRLAESHRGFFIPLRPDKTLLESQLMHQHEFVEHRRASLEKYLQRLAAHPVIGRSEELRGFLLDGSNGWAAPQEARGGRGMVTVFKEWRQAVRNDLVGGKRLQVEEEEGFLERKRRMEDLAVRIDASSGKVKRVGLKFDWMHLLDIDCYTYR